MSGVIGNGSMERPLTDAEVRGLCEQALGPLDLTGKKVLILIPDHTRHARLGVFFRVTHGILGGKAMALDYLIATGTHIAMEPENI